LIHFYKRIKVGEMDTSAGEETGMDIQLDLVAIKSELLRVLKETSQRGLLHTSKWLAEINHALRSVSIPENYSPKPPPPPMAEGETTPAVLASCGPEQDALALTKTYFDLKEYDRAAFFAKELLSPAGQFLHFYSRYLGAEKRRLEDMTDTGSCPDNGQLVQLRQLRVELEQLHKEGQLDPYTLYVYGVVLRKLALHDLALPVLCQSIQGEPGHWGAWLELSCLITTREKLFALQLPDHWIRHLFTAHTYLELQQNEEALQIYFGLSGAGLQDSTYVMAQIAIAFHNMRQVDQAVDYFKQLSEVDPFRLDNMDTYSNLLYVKEQRVELAHLAHRTNQIDKYRTETCCVIGNYYSLSSQHEKAVLYFQRALKLNPGYLSALTLMGHEYMEMKNTHAAIQSYRQAIEVNRRDYRAWYGLGQTYEMLKMPFYCLYYYKQAQELRPSDSRMLVALGESYEKLDKIQDAMKCYWKAHCVGDIEGGIALLKLARLYERTNEVDQAAAAYTQYIQETEGQGIPDRDDQGQAYKFLGYYHLRLDQLPQAYEYAMKCTELVDVREDGKALLKEIASKRSHLSARENSREPRKPADLEDQSFVSIRLRPSISNMSSSPDQSMVRDLEPVNLNFTPTGNLNFTP